MTFLACDRIEDLPDKCFPRFQTSLRELYIDNNKIRVLPFGMHALDVLESFSLQVTRDEALGFTIGKSAPSTAPRDLFSQQISEYDQSTTFFSDRQRPKLTLPLGPLLQGNPVGHPPVDYSTEGFPTLRKYWKRIASAELSGICELPSMSLQLFPPEFCFDPNLAENVR